MSITKYTIINFLVYEVFVLATVFILDIDTLIAFVLVVLPLPIFWLIDRYWPKNTNRI